MKTFYLETESTDPYYNLAFEEYVLTHRLEGSYLLLWQNDNAIIIGQNQNTVAEINAEFVREHGIRVVRRTTGGGAVYHDLGNLNYSFIGDTGNIEELSYLQFVEPVVNALKKMGLDASASGRNDILVSGKKVSGTAQRIHKHRVLHHGTLLFDTDTSIMSGALNVDEAKFRSKASKSVRSRVGNIKEFIKEVSGEEISLVDFWFNIKQSLSESGLEEISLSEDEIKEIVALKESKYNTWEWNYGRSPKYETENTGVFPAGIVHVTYTVDKGGILSEIDFTGDFLSRRDLSPVRDALVGTRFTTENLRQILTTLSDFSDYFGGVTVDEILEIL